MISDSFIFYYMITFLTMMGLLFTIFCIVSIIDDIKSERIRKDNDKKLDQDPPEYGS